MPRTITCSVDSKKKTYQVTQNNNKYQKKTKPYEEGWPACAGYEIAEKAGVPMAGGRIGNQWTQFLKEYANEHNIAYGDAMKSVDAQNEYRRLKNLK